MRLPCHPVDASFFDTARIRAGKPGQDSPSSKIAKTSAGREASSTAFLKRRFVSKKSSEPTFDILTYRVMP
jgi:hypothetical protein